MGGSQVPLQSAESQLLLVQCKRSESRALVVCATCSEHLSPAPLEALGGVGERSISQQQLGWRLGKHHGGVSCRPGHGH